MQSEPNEITSVLGLLIYNIFVEFGTRWMSYKKQEQLIIRQHLGSLHVLGGVRVAHEFSFLCCVFALFVFAVYNYDKFWLQSKRDYNHTVTKLYSRT
jgi:hypothetical protein